MSVRASVFASDLALRETGGARRSFGGWLHTVAYALWFGGLLAIGALVAPNTALLIHSYPAFSTNLNAQHAILTGIVGRSFRLFNYVCYGSGGVMIFCDILQAYSSEPTYSSFTWTRTFFTVLLLGSALYLGYYLFPHMDAAQALDHMRAFDKMHKQYVLITEIQLIPLLIIPALTARRDQALDSLF